jgi:YidC/Oxa1 family membrane protein insertase
VTDKRTILALVLCAGILFVWTKFFTPTPPPPAPVAANSPPSAATAPAGPPAAPGAGAVPSVAASADPAGAPTVVAERETVIETPTQRFVFSNRGAALRHTRLLEPKYEPRKGEEGKDAHGIDLVRAQDPKLAPFKINFPKSGFSSPADTAWQLVENAPPPPAGTQQVVYRAETPAVTIEKRFLFDSTRYRMHLDVTVENRAPTVVDHHLEIQVSGYQDPDSKGGFFSGASSNTASVLCHMDDTTTRSPLEKLEKEALTKVGGVRWVGTDEKFFLMAVIPYPETPPRERTCTGTSPSPGVGLGTLSFAERSLTPGTRTTYSFAIYLGPKVVADLDEVRPGGADVKLTESVDVSLAFISRPMLFLLKLFHGFVGNWGVAIIMLTIFIRLLTFYPTQKSLLSAKKMQKLGPKLAAIRKKYENDRQRQSQETMSLYKTHGVSPFGGCLPSLIQMPIWIALYSTLNYAVELYREPFILHIKDLTAKDPFHLGPIPLPLTPLLMGAVMFVQMKMSPTSPDNQQQAMMSIMMPIMFTMFSLVLPSGLAVYMLTSYSIGIVQQLWINHLDRKANAPALAKA